MQAMALHPHIEASVQQQDTEDRSQAPLVCSPEAPPTRLSSSRGRWHQAGALPGSILLWACN